jgi:hypothetical protein
MVKAGATSPIRFDVVQWGLGVTTAAVENATRRANAVQKSFVFRRVPGPPQPLNDRRLKSKLVPDGLLLEDGVVSLDKRGLLPKGNVILVTARGYTDSDPDIDPARDRLDNGLYFFEDEVDSTPRAAIVSTYLWSQLGQNPAVPGFARERPLTPYLLFCFAQIALSRFVPESDYHETDLGCPFDYNDTVRNIDQWFERSELFLPHRDCKLCAPVLTSALNSGELPFPVLSAAIELLKWSYELARQSPYLSAFISYGQPDADLAARLRNDLRDMGVNTWLYAADARAGNRTWHEITQARQSAERFLILCSSSAFVRDGVLHELENQIDERPDLIIPILIDDEWTKEEFKLKRGRRDLKSELVSRNWIKCDPGDHASLVARVLKALQRR